MQKCCYNSCKPYRLQRMACPYSPYIMIVSDNRRWTRNKCYWVIAKTRQCCHRFPNRFLRSASMSSTSFSASFFFCSASCSKACTLCLTSSASSWGLAAGLELLHHANQSPCLCWKLSNQATQTYCRWPPTHQKNSYWACIHQEH